MRSTAAAVLHDLLHVILLRIRPSTSTLINARFCRPINAIALLYKHGMDTFYNTKKVGNSSLLKRIK